MGSTGGALVADAQQADRPGILEASARDEAGWSDSSARAVLQLMVESVAEMVGFEVAALSVVLGDQLVTMAYTGPEEFREYLEQPDPVTVLDPVLAQAEEWGRWRFLAAEDWDGAEPEGHWVIFDEDQDDVPDAWNPRDALIAVLADDEGRMVGAMSVDRPTTRRRPDARQRSLLERYAAQAERAVITAFEREELVRQVAHAESARQLIRSAAIPAQASLEAVLELVHRPLVDGYRASGSWIQVLEEDGRGRGYVRGHDGEPVPVSEQMLRLAHQLAPLMWADQRIVVVTENGRTHAPPHAAPLVDEARRQLVELGLTSALGISLGVGTQCVGFLVLGRGAHEPPWSPGEISSAIQIGHDLGAALATARALERERNMVRELQQLEDYRTQLIHTLSHELRTPLTVITGNLELLNELDLEQPAPQYRDAMSRGTRRMATVVDDLLLLARVSDPRHPLERVPVDVRQLARDVVAMVGSSVRAESLTVRLELGDEELMVPGDPSEVDRLLTNLVSNAVKYTGAGGSILVAAERNGSDVVLRVADTGMGISEDDQIGLFSPFYRTTNPEALNQPGTGLGLSIVATIVARHHGRVEVKSQLGEGTTFSVVLPALAGR
jgi:signal transduction histidine kinase